MKAPAPIVATGGCCCGAVRFRCGGTPRSVVQCHCGQCRRLSGAAFTTWVSFAKEALSLSGQASLSVFQATENVTRHFCKVCGSHVYTSDARFSNVVGVPAGAIEGELPAKPSAHYFVSHKAAWHTINDALPQFAGESGVEPQDA
ncbi:GFA family protein [Variovorax sp. LjRoot84]|uniref:GFA family protein n=1 Tax=Variovorax sp. LjRoot84 TaxID=3342340 RepID=UPI003F514541